MDLVKTVEPVVKNGLDEPVFRPSSSCRTNEINSDRKKEKYLRTYIQGFSYYRISPKFSTGRQQENLILKLPVHHALNLQVVRSFGDRFGLGTQGSNCECNTRATAASNPRLFGTTHHPET